MSLEAVRSRLASAKKSLERRKEGDAELYARVSAVEKGVVSKMLRPTVGAMDDDLRAQLIEEIDDLPWADDDGIELTKLVVAKATPTYQKKQNTKRRDMQDFRNFVDSMTAEEWGTLTDDNVSPQQIRDRLITVLCRLGCRCASEPTKKLAVSLWLHLSGSTKLEADAKKIHMVKFGCDLYNQGRRAGAPDVYLTLLHMPNEMETTHPELVAKVFGEAPAVPCPIDQVKLLQEDAGSKCRGNAGSMQMAKRLRTQSVPVIEEGMFSGSGVQAFGMMMLKGMEQMNATQNEMLELVLGGGSSVGRLSPTSPIEKTPRGFRRALTLGDSDEVATGDNFHALEDQQLATA